MNRAKYEAVIRELQNSLSFQEYSDVIMAKILDWIARNNLQKDITKRELQKALEPFWKPQWRSFTAKTTGAMEDIITALNIYYRDMGPEVNRQAAKIQSMEKAANARFGRYSEVAQKQIVKVVREAALKDYDIHQIRRELHGLDEKLNFYADTLAKTTVKALSRGSKNEKARLGEVFWFEYVGIKRDTTRPFCLAMIGQTRHVDIIRQMRNGQIETVLQFCGGYNCHHDWEPDPFYKPTGKERIVWEEVTVGRGRTMKYTLNL